MKNMKRNITFAFDLDNTLVKTDVANNNSYVDAIRIVTGRDITINPNIRFTKENLYSLLPDLSDNQMAKIITLKKELFSNHLASSVLNTELASILKMLFINGNKTILLTNSCKERANKVCSYYDLNKYFHNQYYFEDYDKNKYHFLNQNYNLESVVLFENESDSINDAIKNGLIKNNIITVKF